MEDINLETTCVLSERWPVHPFSGQFDDPRFRGHTVHYQVKFSHRPYMIVETQNLTVLKLQHAFQYEGDEDQFARWGRGEGGPRIAIYITDVINRLVDLVQASFKRTELNPFPHIRHAGIRDFYALDTLCGPRRQNLISYAMPVLDAGMARRSIGMVSAVNFAIADEPPKETIKMLRAVELLNCGYRTEALLVAFSVLDSAVQEALITILKDRGVTDPKGLLEAIPGSRLKTFLGPVLKVLTGRSLEDDRLELWGRLGKCNEHRNVAIHEAIDMKYEQSKEGIQTVRDILLYLSEIPRPIINYDKCDETIMPKLDIKDLPFLLE